MLPYSKVVISNIIFLEYCSFLNKNIGFLHRHMLAIARNYFMLENIAVQLSNIFPFLKDPVIPTEMMR